MSDTTIINTHSDYQQVKAEVEILLQKATDGGGFNSLSETEDEELLRLSYLMKAWEERYYPMPTFIHA
jgi:HTH-type transcriptional regulator / antitoxin HigA